MAAAGLGEDGDVAKQAARRIADGRRSHRHASSFATASSAARLLAGADCATPLP